MKIPLLHRFLVIFLWFFITTSPAALHLELTKGIKKAIPIAIVPFQSQTLTPLTDIIVSDLGNSGQFKLISTESMPEQPHSANDTNLSAWQQRHINYIATGQINTLDNHRYEIRFQLIDTYSKQQPIVFSQQFTASQKELRQLAHHIADKIYQKLTGKRGIFSTHIAYVLVKHPFQKNRQYQLILADADGFNPRPLLTSNMPIMSPRWSPDGKQIAYVSFAGGKAGIYVQTIATGKRVKISDQSGINGAPSWSPDGRKLAIVLSKTGYPKIYTLEIASRKLTQLTQGWSIDTEPTFSPDGNLLFFTSNRGGSPQIYQLALASGKVERMTFSGRYNARASITPNDKTLVMLNRGNAGFNIAKQNLKTGNVMLLTHSNNTQSPSVSPNGDMIVYAINQRDRQMLAMVSIDGQVKLRLPSQAGNVREPAWSPFFRR